MSHLDLDRALRVDRASGGDAGSFRADVPAGWRQGRGVYGGATMGLLARAATLLVGAADRPMRALHGSIVAPVPDGPLELRAATVREGSSVTTVDVTLARDGETYARATAMFGKTRRHPGRFAPSPPAIPAWEELPVAPIGPPLGPEFAANLEVRNLGPIPFSGGPMEASGFVRARAPTAELGPPELAALVDTYWPAIFPAMPSLIPTSTLGFGAQFFPATKPLSPTTPLYYRAKAEALADGYLAELRELWTVEGELVVRNEQTFVILG